MSELVSVIVPVYNGAEKLHICLDSLIASDYENLEILVVNDGSSDDTGAVAAEYAGKDSRIRVIHQENAGVSAARNAGLDRARGAYVFFADGDDRVYPDAISKLLRCCQAGADVASIQFARVDEGGRRLPDPREPIQGPFALTPEELARDYFHCYRMGIVNCVYCKLYRRAVIGDLRFPRNLKWGEDCSFNLQVFGKMNRMSVIPDIGYDYIIYPGQTTSRRMPGFTDMIIRLYEQIDAYIRSYGGYEEPSVRQDMGAMWVEVFIDTAHHSRSLSAYRRDFRRLRTVPWAAYLEHCRPWSRKQQVIHKMIGWKLPEGVYAMTRLHKALNAWLGRG